MSGELALDPRHITPPSLSVKVRYPLSCPVVSSRCSLAAHIPPIDPCPVCKEESFACRASAAQGTWAPRPRVPFPGHPGRGSLAGEYGELSAPSVPSLSSPSRFNQFHRGQSSGRLPLPLSRPPLRGLRRPCSGLCDRAPKRWVVKSAASGWNAARRPVCPLWEKEKLVSVSAVVSADSAGLASVSV